MLKAALCFGAPAAFATDPVTGTYTLPTGATQFMANAEAAATEMTSQAFPYIGGIALAFAALALIWLVVKAVRRGAR